MPTQKIYVAIDNERIELTGDDKEKYLAQKELDDLEELRFANQLKIKQEARVAAQAKLAALGLTVEDLTALGL